MANERPAISFSTYNFYQRSSLRLSSLSCRCWLLLRALMTRSRTVISDEIYGRVEHNVDI